MVKASKDIDWLNILDFKRALVSVHYEIQGDWYRDPWGWPELDWLVKSGQSQLVTRLNASGVRRVAKVDVPKENFGTRPAIVMDPVDRLVYQALVDRNSSKLIGKLRPWVFGWRLQLDAPADGEWSHNDIQHSAFRDTVNLAASFSGAALRSDIVSCFASIDVIRLSEMILGRAGVGAVGERTVDLIRGWDNVAGRRGLAQRSAASAALANLYLTPLDDVLHAHNRRQTKGRARARGILKLLGDAPRVARWMDDLWVFGQDPGQLRHVQLELQEVLRSIGLEMNHSKTELLEGDRVYEVVKQVQHSAIEDALLDDEPNPGPLRELVEQLLASPTTADRTSIKFATRRMRQHGLYDQVGEFAEKAREMPHGADALARLFRDSEHWRDLPKWFVKYEKSEWGAMRWSVAQLGTAFPSKVATQADRKRLRPVQELFGSLIEAEAPLPLLALAAQRLSTWEPDDSRALFRSVANDSSDPHVRRILALAAANAKEDRAAIRIMLSEFEENLPTMEMLEATRFTVRTKADFDG